MVGGSKSTEAEHGDAVPQDAKSGVRRTRKETYRTDLDEPTHVRELAPLAADPSLWALDAEPEDDDEALDELLITSPRPAVTSAILAYAFAEPGMSTSRPIGPSHPRGQEPPTIFVAYEELSSDELELIEELESTAEVAAVDVTEEGDVVEEGDVIEEVDVVEEVDIVEELDAGEELQPAAAPPVPPAPAPQPPAPQPIAPPRAFEPTPPLAFTAPSDVASELFPEPGAGRDLPSVVPIVTHVAPPEAFSARPLRSRAIVPACLAGALVGVAAVLALFVSAPPEKLTHAAWSASAESGLVDLARAADARATPQDEATEAIVASSDPSSPAVCVEATSATAKMCGWVSALARGDAAQPMAPADIQAFYAEQRIQPLRGRVVSTAPLASPAGAWHALTPQGETLCVHPHGDAPRGGFALWAHMGERTPATDLGGERFDCDVAEEVSLPNHVAMLASAENPARKAQLAQLVLRDLALL